MTFIHVVCGTVALLAVPAALFVRRGGVWHRRFGAVFTLAMAVVLFSAGFLWQAKGHLFLVPLAAVTAYLLFNAWRVIARRRRGPDPVDDRIDMFAAFAGIAAGAATAYLGLTEKVAHSIGIASPLIGIGSIAICFALNDLLGFRSRRAPKGWLLAHLSAMLAAYISASTAFLVINAHHAPMLLRWLVPSAIGSLAIAGYSLSVLLPRRRRAKSDSVASATVRTGRAALH